MVDVSKRRPVRPAAVERIDEALTFDSGEAVAVLHGPGATDLFCCLDLHLRPIDAALLHRLKDAGYERVVFCTLDGLYHLDEAPAGRAQPTRADGGLHRFQGPRGRQDALTRPEPPERSSRPSLGGSTLNSAASTSSSSCSRPLPSSTQMPRPCVAT